MAAFVGGQMWIQVERLPGYAPHLDPCEGLWANLKGGALANPRRRDHGPISGAPARRSGVIIDAWMHQRVGCECSGK